MGRISIFDFPSIDTNHFKFNAIYSECGIRWTFSVEVSTAW